MIVLCENSDCGAVLRAAATYSPTQTVVRREGDQQFFDCPRCGKRTSIGAKADGDPPSNSQPQPQLNT
jgi:hypothetical protein